jgi:spermidine synthase
MKLKNSILAAVFLSTVSCYSFADMDTFSETLYPHWGQKFTVSRIILQEKNDVQDLVLFENEEFGKVLALDGIIQTTEKDEFFYHEMITHVPLLAHGNAQNVLIVGGGDGGVLREVLKHKSVKSATLVEIDDRVIDLSKEHLPNHSQGAFSDPRTRIVIQDAFEFLGMTREKFDVIICDTTDPIGPGAVLFTAEFYARCKKALNLNGILVTQNGVPFMQTEEIQNTHEHLSKIFNDATFYVVPVPTYVGGFMTLGWASDNKNLRSLNTKIIEQRLNRDVTGDLKYYTASIQSACFVLPKYIEDALKAPVKALEEKPAE